MFIGGMRMSNSAKLQLLYHYILRDNAEYAKYIKASAMVEVKKGIQTLEEVVLLHPKFTMRSLAEGKDTHLTYGNKIVFLNKYIHEGKTIGWAALSLASGKIYYYLVGEVNEV